MRLGVSVSELQARLCASDSATEVIGDLFGRPVTVRRLACDPPPLSPARLARLGTQPVHRRVLLLAAGRPVSEADLWYVPARLWPGMEESLRSTNAPFGQVVSAMRPRRETLSARICAKDEPYLLEHEALLQDSSGRPIALVLERYLRPS